MPFSRFKGRKVSSLPPEIELSETTDASSYYTTSDEDSRHVYRGNRRGYHTRSLTPYRIDISTGVTISYERINCYAPEFGKGLCGRSVKTGRYRQLLFDVCGVVQPNMLVAIMGASGAGKSTLLNILTCRNLGNLRVEGTVKANGVDMGSNIKSVSAYVQQDDLFWGRLRVREHLWYNAVLRMGRAFTTEEKRQRVETVIKEMGLERCADDYINQKRGSGISGSERKLLSIACEILTDPPLLFCDEPTTGLDAMMAENVIKMLQAMAQRGKTVLCTIHQPASHIYYRFDQVLLLAEGRVAFMGSKERAVDYFSEVGFPCPVNYNPADHYIHTLAIRPGQETECRAKVVYISRKFRDTVEYETTVKQIIAIDQMEGDPAFEEIHSVTSNSSPYKATWCMQLRVNIWKQFLDIVRDPHIFGARVAQNVISTIIMCVMFFQQPYNQVGVANISGAVFNLILNMTFLALVQLNSFTSELTVFYREHHNGMYRTDTFFLAKNIAEIPLFIITVGTAVIASYWAMGLYPAAENFLIFCLVLVLVYQFSLSLNVYFIGIACGRVDIALNIAPPIRVAFMLMGGYLVNDASIPNYIQWLKWLSWHRYSYELLMLNQWGKVEKIDCEYGPQIDDSACYHSGKDVIKFMNFKESSISFDYTMMIALTIFFRVLALFTLWLRGRERKRTK